MSSTENKNHIISYLPVVAILIFLGVMIFCIYYYLPVILRTNVSDGWISYLPLVIFLITFGIIEWKKKIVVTRGGNI
ncbi:MAG: hypothetical protein ACTSO9_19610 [Candidatus Helarchaeota archaeon]